MASYGPAVFPSTPGPALTFAGLYPGTAAVPGPSLISGDASTPAADLYPGATTYPGQGNLPLIQCLLSFDDVSDSSPYWVAVENDKFRSFTVTRGRESELQDFDAGSATVVLDNRDRAYDPTYNKSVTPMNRIWLYEDFSGERHSLFKGYVESWDQQWPSGGWSDAIVEVSAVDEFKRLNLHTLPTSGTIPASPDVPQQLTFILDTIGSDAPRSMPSGFAFPTAGGTLDVREMTGQSSIDELRNSMSVENVDAAWFAANDGTLTFLGRSHRSFSSYINSQITCIDAPSTGAGVYYQDVDIDYSESFLYNEIVVQATLGSYSFSDTTSINRYGKRTRATTTLPLTDAIGTDAIAIASALLAKYKDPQLRVTRIVFDTSNPEVSGGTGGVQKGVFGVDLMYDITIKKSWPGGGQISSPYWVQKIEVSGANDGSPVKLAWSVSPM